MWLGGLGGLREALVMGIVSSVTSWRIVWVCAEAWTAECGWTGPGVQEVIPGYGLDSWDHEATLPKRENSFKDRVASDRK